MGGHDTPRTDPIYEEVVRAAFQLTRAGYLVATGGGLGIMEAGNLGAWLAGAPDDERIKDALSIISKGPAWSRKNRTAFLDAGEAVIKRWPGGAESLGMATWVYRDEPVSQFATSIAKYFNNNIRENGLLSLATSGVIYAPGGAGTSQEIFTDAAQNSYRIFDVASPMIFLGRRNYMDAEAALTAALQAQAVGAKHAWDDKLAVVDRAEDAVQFIREHDPIKASGVTPEPGDRARERQRR